MSPIVFQAIKCLYQTKPVLLLLYLWTKIYPKPPSITNLSQGSVIPLPVPPDYGWNRTICVSQAKSESDTDGNTLCVKTDDYPDKFLL